MIFYLVYVIKSFFQNVIIKHSVCWLRPVLSLYILPVCFRSAYLMAAYRPRCPIMAITRDAQTARQMHLYRGILPIHYKGKTPTCIVSVYCD